MILAIQVIHVNLFVPNLHISVLDRKVGVSKKDTVFLLYFEHIEYNIAEFYVV